MALCIGGLASLHDWIAAARDLTENFLRFSAGVVQSQHKIERESAAAMVCTILNDPGTVTALGDHQAKAGLLLIPIDGTLGGALNHGTPCEVCGQLADGHCRIP